MQACDDAVGRKRRNDIKEALVAGVGNAAVAEVHRNGVEAVVRKHNSLGHAGRAAGERHGSKFKFAVPHSFHALALTELQKFLPAYRPATDRHSRCGHFYLLEHLHNGGHVIIRRNDYDLLERKLIKHIRKMLIRKIKKQQDICTGAYYKLLYLAR